MQDIFMSDLDMEMSEDGRKIVKMSSFKKKAISASNRFKNSFKKKTRRSSIKIVSVDDINTDDRQTLDAFREELAHEDLLPSKHDDLHMMLRLFNFSSVNID